MGCPGEDGYSQGTEGIFQVCGRTSKVCDEVGPWIVNNTDPSSVILSSKRLKALFLLRRTFSEAPISYFQYSSAWDLPGVNVVWLLPTALGMFQLLS